MPIRYLNKVLYLFSGNQTSLVALTALYLLTSALEVFGIGLIGVFLKFAENPEAMVSKNPLIRRLYTDFGFQDLRQFVLSVGILIMLLFAIKAILFMISQNYTWNILLGQQKILRNKLYRYFLLAPYEFYMSCNSAELINKIIGEVNRFIFTTALPFVTLVSQLIVFLALLILLFRTDASLLLTLLLAMLPVCLVFVFLSKRIQDWGRLLTVSHEEVSLLVGHGIGGVKEIRVIGCEPYFMSKMDHVTSQAARIETNFQTIQLLPRASIETLLVVCILGFVCLSLLSGDREFQDVLSSMGVFAISGLRMVPAASAIVVSLSAMRNSTHTLDLLYADLKEVEANSHSTDLQRNLLSDSHIKPIKFNEQIELQTLTYQYPNSSRLTIDHISLSIQKGQSIGLIGKSGAGKTTLVDLILGLLKPESGDIKVDGCSIYDNLSAWRSLIGYIPQSIFLLDDTIVRNIALGLPDHLINRNRLDEAIRLAQLEDLILDLPDGLHTRVGERGICLSGGQRQRIGIARALYHERDVLVLDEATSALDNETEKLVNKAIESLAGLKTLIVIAHRLSTIEHCDHIYMLDKGQVVRSGTYQEVV
jgi:ABC-type multidrug transport system fused ATPase/permease subunit